MEFPNRCWLYKYHFDNYPPLLAPMWAREAPKGDAYKPASEYVRLDSLWHDVSELPEDDAAILVLTTSGSVFRCWVDSWGDWVDFKICCDSEGRTLAYMGETPLKWAYVKDIIPSSNDQENEND